MGINFENQKFDGQNHELLPVQVEKNVSDMQPGDIAYIQTTELWMENDRKAWVNGTALIYELEDLPD